MQGLKQDGNRESRGPVFTIFDHTFHVRGVVLMRLSCFTCVMVFGSVLFNLLLVGMKFVYDVGNWMRN